METNAVNDRTASSGKPWSGPAKKGVSSNIVGGIVEKGFSSSTKSHNQNLPKPTVLPFPVARHRSHGPIKHFSQHWAPLSQEIMDDEEGDGEKDDFDFDPIAPFANPIQRKQKKGLDLSRWRDLVPKDSLPVKQEKKIDSLLHVNSEEVRQADGNVISANIDYSTGNKKLNPETCKESSFMEEDVDAMIWDSGIGVSDTVADMEQTHMDCLSVQGSLEETRTKFQGTGPNGCEDSEPGSSSFVKAEPNGFEDGEVGFSSFADDIDAENRALLQKMSPEEIAEAQAEIMGRMKPGILEMLKKLGQDKLQKQKGVTANLDGGHYSTTEHDGSQLCQDSKSALYEVAKASTATDTMPTTTKTNRSDEGSLLKPPGFHDSCLWNLWTERVEKARELRFTLGGSPVEADSLQVPAASNVPGGSQYNVENVAERDFLRTEGDPGAAGYTIKEAVVLARSMIPGQRVLALQLLASVLDKALYNLQPPDVGCDMTDANLVDKSVDWQAVWAFAVGPEPELVLSLRMALDDNHISVVLAAAKVIQCILSCDMNENFFNISEKLTTYERAICTAPVFRSKQEIDAGFLHGGFWKYSTKPSNIHLFNDENEDDENDEKHTIQDDVVVAAQDVAAGLVRMGVLPRLRYLLEMDPVVALEERLIAVLIGLVRHSPACASAIMKCPRLVQTVVNQFAKKYTMEIHPSMIESVVFLKKLAQSGKKICEDFIKHGVFQDTMWHLYKYAFSLDHWIKSGREYCKLTSALMVEQLRFWKVCIRYGYCISYFPDFFPALCFWLSPPTFDKLIESNVLGEYMSISREAYLTLGALAKQLPYLHMEEQLKKLTAELADDKIETWSWSHVLPMVDLAVKWISLKNSPYLSSDFNQQKGSSNFVNQDSSRSCLLWVISAVMHMLSCIFERIASDSPDQRESSSLPWLPEFVPKIGIEIVRSGWLNFSDVSYAEGKRFPTLGRSFVEDLCWLRYHNNYETSLASACCLNNLIQLIGLVDKSIQMAESVNNTCLLEGYVVSKDDKILQNGILIRSQSDLRHVLIMFMSLVSAEWHDVQSVEMFGRGGPAPGIGLGWGASGGGLWSRKILQAQTDAQLVVGLLQIFPIIIERDPSAVEDINFALQKIDAALGACLIAGPRDTEIVEKALWILLGVPVLKCLDICIHRSLLPNMGIGLLKWEYKEEDYACFSKILKSHFRKRWLSRKRKSDKGIAAEENKSNRDLKKVKNDNALHTIHEDLDLSEANNHDANCASLMIEWAHQRLPLPNHWFLSPISTVVDEKITSDIPTAPNSPNITCLSADAIDITRSGLFLLLGLEASSLFSHTEIFRSPICCVPLVWKLHALSMALLVNMDVLGEDRSRDIYKSLQELYGKLLDQSRHQSLKPLPAKISSLPANEKKCVEFLKFKTEVHESYTTFIENLVEQFSAMSYGDVIYGRQVAFYLHRSVEAPVRLAAWNALSNAHVLELLPSLGACFAEADGYLEPVEDNEGILEAYVKSWISGALDKAATRGSMSFTVVLHHLVSFIFLTTTDDKLSLRKKLVKSLLRDYSRKQQHEGMMLSLIQYKLSTSQELKCEKNSLLPTVEIKRRFEFLVEACEGNSSLLFEVEKLKASI